MHHSHKIVFPDSHKHSNCPRLKKPFSYLTDRKSYWLILNLGFVLKTAKQLIINSLAAHASLHSPFPVHQSAYQQYHVTTTAIVSVHNNIVRTTDAGIMSALVLMDLSVAFDTVDHEIRINVLRDQFGISWIGFALTTTCTSRHSRCQIIALGQLFWHVFC